MGPRPFVTMEKRSCELSSNIDWVQQETQNVPGNPNISGSKKQ